MITTNVKELCKLRGIKTPLTVLRKAGISHFVSHELINGKKHRITHKQIEILCTLLRCTPNELFAWIPNEPKDDYPAHPLQAIRKRQITDLNEVLKSMSVGEIEKMLEERKKLEKANEGG